MSSTNRGSVYSAKPFIKWVGGKRQLIPELEKHLPSSFNRYHEPFVGGGALFWHLGNTGRLGKVPVFLSDSNERLVKTYIGIRDNVDWVVEALRLDERKHRRDPDKHFHEVRARRDVDRWDPPDVAAWFIYLNRTCYNGLYRVNGKGHFNAPLGDYDNPTICDEENLRACSSALQGVEIEVADFQDSIARARAGDLVYCDPPYVPLSATSSFTSYTRDGFDDEDQRELQQVSAACRDRDAHVILSNSSAPAVRELYANWEIHEVSARRNVSCKGNGRGAIKELIMTGTADPERTLA
jgi:DNA adenine methylase